VDLYAIVSVEDSNPREKVMMGMLATLSIEKGNTGSPAASALSSVYELPFGQCVSLQITTAAIGTNSPFAALHKSVSFWRVICRLWRRHTGRC